LTLHGRIFDGEERPLAGVHVAAFDSLGRRLGIGDSDKDGSFALLDIPRDPIAESPEVPLHALGDSVASSAVAVQRDLGGYRTEGGGFVLDELDLIMPVRVRVDPLGQVLASVLPLSTTGAAPAASGQLRLRVRFSNADATPVTTSGQSVHDLGLSATDVALLERLQLFSVDDVLRIGRNSFGRQAFDRIGTALPPAHIVARAEIVAAGAPRELFRVVETPEKLLAADATALAARVQTLTRTAIAAEDVKRWQDVARRFVTT
jgi:hypothetical protein